MGPDLQHMVSSESSKIMFSGVNHREKELLLCLQKEVPSSIASILRQPRVCLMSSPVELTLTLLFSCRSPLLNQTRLSPQGGKSQHVQQRWRSKGYRCIGGVMYQVSANKLSKTSSTPGRGKELSTKSPGRAGEQQEFVPI